MREHTQTSKTKQTARQLVALIRAHGIEADTKRGTIRAQEVASRQGIVTREWVALEPDYQTIRAWLGY